MTDEKRTYRKKKRADQEAQTVLRITEAAVQLHGSVGPSQTTMSAIADAAGVRRSTLYRHFPDEAAVFRACSAHFMGMHPLPDLAAWAAIADPDVRLSVALRQLYRLYSETAQMLANILRDSTTMPVVAESLSLFQAYVAAAHGALMAGRDPAQAERGGLVPAAVGHAIAFTSWQSLVQQQGMSDEQAADLMCRFVSATADN